MTKGVGETSVSPTPFVRLEFVSMGRGGDRKCGAERCCDERGENGLEHRFSPSPVLRSTDCLNAGTVITICTRSEAVHALRLLCFARGGFSESINPME